MLMIYNCFKINFTAIDLDAIIPSQDLFLLSCALLFPSGFIL